MAVLTAVTSVAPGRTESPVAIFSDALNHASIVDGVRVAQRQSNAEVHVYRHNDMMHLHQLLTNCKRERKVVVTDSLFSMDGDFAPLKDLAALRKKHGFLLIIDEVWLHLQLISSSHCTGSE
jgi:8-amino-7-oxononanoate synthase